MAEATTNYPFGEVQLVCTAALASGQVCQLPDGRAGVYAGLQSSAIGDTVALYTSGNNKVTKSTSVVFTAGDQVWWDSSANEASYARNGVDDFFVGACTKDATAADTTVETDMNVMPAYDFLLSRDVTELTYEATLGLGVTQGPSGAAGVGAYMLSFDAVAEAAQAAMFGPTLDVDDKLVFEAKVAVFGIGDASNLDINIGLASASHATDLGAVTALATIHLAGASLNINAQSDDGGTDVAPTDTTIDAVDDTPFWLKIDARDKASVKFYINGARVLSATTFVLTAYTSTLVPIAHIEKTSDDTVADFRVYEMRVRKQGAAA